MKLTAIARQTALATILAAIAGSAAASSSTYTLPTNNTPILAAVSGSGFSDTFNFNLGSLSNIFGGGTSSAFSVSFGSWTINVPAVTFTSVLLDGTSIWSGSSSTFSFSSSNLALGSHSLTIFGNTGAGANVGGYVAQMQAQPVPEAETYAMMLAGLGIIGLMARRRKRGV